MTEGRTTLNWWRAYVDGYDMSGYSRSFGELGCTFEEGIDDAVTLRVKAALASQAMISMGALNGLFDNTPTSGLHVVMKGAGVKRNVMIAAGIQAEPALGDPVFGGKFVQLGYYGNPNNPIVHATIPFGNMHADAMSDLGGYAEPWGKLLHAKAARTAVNAANGIGGLGQTTKGGYMMYHILDAAGSGGITAALKVQHATTAGGSYSDLLSTGTLTLGASGTFAGPTSGIVALAQNATVESFTRWQIVLTLATSVTFVLGFFRNWK
jgi:hypothetical protein